MNYYQIPEHKDLTLKQEPFFYRCDMCGKSIGDIQADGDIMRWYFTDGNYLHKDHEAFRDKAHAVQVCGSCIETCEEVQGPTSDAQSENTRLREQIKELEGQNKARLDKIMELDAKLDKAEEWRKTWKTCALAKANLLRQAVEHIECLWDIAEKHLPNYYSNNYIASLDDWYKKHFDK